MRSTRQSLPDRNPTSKTAWLCAVAALVAGTHPANLHAATLCTSIVESGWASAPTEEEATNRAIMWWKSRAGAIGRGYESWDRAQRKDIRCEPKTDKDAVRCKALAAPCLPEGMTPEPKTGDPFLEL